MRKSYRVSPGLKPLVRRILLRSFYTCRMHSDEDGTIWCDTNASSDTFHKIVQRAKCEKKTEETGTFWVTSREANNPVYLAELLRINKVKVFSVIDDKEGKKIIE